MSQNELKKVNELFIRLEKFIPTRERDEFYDELCTVVAEAKK